MSDRIPEAEWQWHGLASHFILGDRCQFHLSTTIGDYLVSTIGAMLPDAHAREVYAEVRGITLEGMGDAREADYMKKLGFEALGAWGRYETLVFAYNGEACSDPECRYGANCGAPMPTSFMELDGQRYDDAAAARAGHLAYCEKAALGTVGAEEHAHG